MGSTSVQDDEIFLNHVTFILNVILRNKACIEELAMGIVKKFRSLANFIAAPDCEFMYLGFNEEQILFIRSISNIIPLYSENTHIQQLNFVNDAFDFLIDLIGYKECFREILIALDDENRIIGVEKLTHINNCGVKADYKKICSICLNAGFKRVIYAHNDPGNGNEPLLDNMDDFEKLEFILASIYVELVDGIVVSSSNGYSWMENQFHRTYYRSAFKY